MIFKGVILSIIMWVATILVLPVLVCIIPEDYFLHQQDTSHRHASPRMRWGRRLLKNITGFLLVVAGIIMLFIPGQGLLTIFLGFFLMDFPGKQLFEKKLIRIRHLRITLNWIRKKKNVNELKFP